MVAGERADGRNQRYKLSSWKLRVRYDRVVEDRDMHGAMFFGEVVSTPQVSVQDLRIAMASALIR